MKYDEAVEFYLEAECINPFYFEQNPNQVLVIEFMEQEGYSYIEVLDCFIKDTALDNLCKVVNGSKK